VNPPQTWLQITLAAVNQDSEEIEQALLAAGACSVTLSDAADDPVLEPLPGEIPLWSQTLVSGLFEGASDEAAIREQLITYLGSPVLTGYRSERLPERAWERVWLDDFKPMQFGRRLWICPGDQPPPDPHAVNILLDPGLAFGTGTHPTTALCLNYLDAAGLPAKTVIDYGCGSGILAIAAVKLGATRVWAVDIDPQALLACEQNAARNQVAESIVVLAPDDLPGDPVDCLLANILAGPLIGLAPRFATLIRAGGRIVLSGILVEQIAGVQTAYAKWFDFAPPQQRQEWALLSATRKNY
jgi:ribosomal protein L11 methyltransferase